MAFKLSGRSCKFGGENPCEDLGDEVLECFLGRGMGSLYGLSSEVA